MQRFVPRSAFAITPSPALGTALSMAAACLTIGCNAGRLRDAVGEQVRAIGDRLRGASARERYADDLRGTGDGGAALAQAWIAAGDRALAEPAIAPLSLYEQGAFGAGTPARDEPAALAWRVHPKRGERVTARLDATADSGARVFSELWQENARDPNARRMLASGESAHATYDVTADDANAVYVLRVQPEARRRVRWNIAFGVGPSLAFPVEGKDARAIASGWGTERDGGARSHEGVDIMARRGTPALAAEDGVVGYVGDDRLGGRVVSVAVAGRGHSLYYAHLDTQAVHGGQAVHAGDTVGFIGNTGNARGGPTHLHFGIYTAGGAVDPLPYLDDRRRAASAPGHDTVLVGLAVQTSPPRSTLALRTGPSAGATVLAMLAPRTPLAVEGVAGGGWLHVRLPDGRGGTVGYVPADAVERVKIAPVARGVAATGRPAGAPPAGLTLQDHPFRPPA